MTLYIDIETYSSVDLRKSSVYQYTEAPDFEIMMAAWALDDDPIRVAIGRDEIFDIPGLIESWTMKVAHNAPFERICFSRFYGMPTGEYLDPEPWEDTAALAAEAGYPRSLSTAAKALKVSDKDEAGTALINWFCKPDRKGNRRRPEDYPEKWAAFVEYCRQDVVVLRDLHRVLPPWPAGEREVYMVDQRINDRGITIDRPMALAAIRQDESGRARAGAELRGLLDIENPNSVVQITGGLKNIGLEVEDLRSGTVDDLLASNELVGKERRALELRKETSLVAAKKYQAAVDACSSDDRLRGQFRFYGAHTGRWSSRGVQIQNLPKLSLDKIEARILDLRMGAELDPTELKALVRSLFVGPFTVVDYSSIEARGLAWLAGESWVLDAFREKRDIYTETAKRMSTPDRPLNRQQGKVAVLALGYAGGIHSLRTMGAEGTDEELQAQVYAYRDANPKIRRSWTMMEQVFLDGGHLGPLRVDRRRSDRHLVLPSGRALTYHGVVLAHGEKGKRIMFDDPGRQGHKADTYGGRLIENATQAICRDVLAEAMVNLERLGYPVVGHVHDEVIVEGNHSVDEIAKVICELPSWAAGFPIDAEGFQCARYKKG